MSAGRKSRGTADGLRLKRYADELAPAFSTAHPSSVLLPDFSQCGDSCALRATMILISFYSVLAGLRPAGSHCENSGSSDGIGASARSGSAKQRSLLCPLSERGCRHPLLFAVLDLLVLLDQAKSTRNSVRRKTSDRFFGKYPAPSIRRFPARSRFTTFLLHNTVYELSLIHI